MVRLSSQSPSLRGSGRFERLPPPKGGAIRFVSIPFIAGQWSLRKALPTLAPDRRQVSIPFIAGQWSLQVSTNKAKKKAEVSIPFIAGQWSLPVGETPRRRCVEVVSIPFIAGQWSLRSSDLQSCPQGGRVSIPFIAGQWSLQAEAQARKEAERRLNPLHCGAVVASTRPTPHHARIRFLVSIPFIAGQWSLRLVSQEGAMKKAQVSIPFIAGQWSLPFLVRCFGAEPGGSQSPSLRGSGRFVAVRLMGLVLTACLNPLHCGAVVASYW